MQRATRESLQQLQLRTETLRLHAAELAKGNRQLQREVKRHEAGAVGFLEKQTSAEILINAIQEVANGRIFYSPSITKRLLDGKKRSLNRNGLSKAGSVRLTSRETEVLQLVAEGSATKQMAAALNISIKTVEKHGSTSWISSTSMTPPD